MSIVGQCPNTPDMRTLGNTLRRASLFAAFFVVFLAMHGTATLNAQKMPVFSNNQLTFNFNEDGSRHEQMTGLLQGWVPHTEMNPGTTIKCVIPT